jgi:methyl-accepting chemotaxis protein
MPSLLTTQKEDTLKQILVRVAGIALVVAGVAGLAFSILGLVVLDRVHERVEPALMEQVELADRTLTATAEGLTLVETSLADAVEMADSLEATMVSVSQAAGDTVPTLDSVGKMVGEQIPETLKATQDTLASVAQSAQLIDDVLAVVTAIPFLGLQSYNPETPLHEGLGDVASSLDEIPTSLITAQEGLDVVSGSLEELQGSFTAIATGIARLTISLGNAQSVVVEYQGVVDDLQQLVASVRQGLPQWLQWLRLGLSLVLVWLGIAQIGLFTQGWELIARGRSKAKEPAPAEAVSEGIQEDDGDESA